jgi:hypothetical protein
MRNAACAWSLLRPHSSKEARPAALPPTTGVIIFVLITRNAHTLIQERESLSRSAFWFWDNLISPRWCAYKCVYWSFNLAERKRVTAKTRLTLHYFSSSHWIAQLLLLLHFALQAKLLWVLYGPKARQGEQLDCSFCLLWFAIPSWRAKVIRPAFF